jgi:hypothetical protein
VYLSSKAADPYWWPKGNSLYGPFKQQCERELSQVFHRLQIHNPTWDLFCLRFGLVRTQMCESLIRELAHLEEIDDKYILSTRKNYLS